MQYRPPEADAGVFDRVVVVDMQVALRLHGQVKQSVLGQERQHVVKEPDAGLDVGFSGSIQVDRERDVGLGGLSLNRCGAVGHELLSRE